MGVRLTVRPNAYLSSLSTSKGTLDPAFDPDVTDYELWLGSADRRITIERETNHPDSRVEYLDEDDSAITDASAADGLQLDLVTGQNIVKVKVTASDGSETRTYTLDIVREAPAPTGTCEVVWCANLTLGNTGNLVGYDRNGRNGLSGGLSPATFTVGGIEFGVRRLAWSPAVLRLFSINPVGEVLPEGLVRARTRRRGAHVLSRRRHERVQPLGHDHGARRNPRRRGVGTAGQHSS